MAPVLLSSFRGHTSLISRKRYRVLLRQIDANFHMNQAAYAEAFEWGRLDWIIRSRAVFAWRRAGVWPVVAEQRIAYRRELKPFARFSIDTRATGIDGRLLVMQGNIIVGDRVYTQCEAKLIFLAPNGVLNAEEMPNSCERFLTEPLAVEDWRVVME
ncbi:MAG: acyl-CoA thioesterase [Myxococcota bacterium]